MKFRWNVYDSEKRMSEHNAYVARNKPKVDAWRARYRHLLNWHQWFAWYPVAVNYMRDDYRFLCVIERRAIPWDVSPGIRNWEYRDLTLNKRSNHD